MGEAQRRLIPADHVPRGGRHRGCPNGKTRAALEKLRLSNAVNATRTEELRGKALINRTDRESRGIGRIALKGKAVRSTPP